MATCCLVDSQIHTNKKCKVEHLVVDSSALIKNAPVHDIGVNVYTVEHLVKEIKDKATIQRLQVLPYELKFKTPSPEDVKYVMDFSKKTGDYPSLSAVDINLLALAYSLAKQYIGEENLNKEPSSCHVAPLCHKPDLFKPLVGFYSPATKDLELHQKDVPSEFATTEEDIQNTEDSNIQNVQNVILPQNEKAVVAKDNTIISVDYSDKQNDSENHIHDTDFNHFGNKSIENCKLREGDNVSDEGWITADNITNAKNQFGELSLQDKVINVACISTDFAMQNVLMQMGLPLVSADGMLIKCAKTFILRCYACFRTTSIMTKQFCPNCGNKTLKRVSVTINEAGEKAIHINFRKPINIRGTRYTLPTPKGGKHASNPILCEDQPVPQNHPSKKALQQTDVFDDDYVALSSPFAIHDVYSRAANLGIRKKNNNSSKNSNPNARKKYTGNRKKK